ncbi:MAG: hypothetical protein IKJ55_04140 [Clostridia bacterium]|nr:hypothetical protein [Clostridia bacterium]
MGLFNWAKARELPSGNEVKKGKQSPLKIYFGVLKRKFFRFITLGSVFFVSVLPMIVFAVFGMMAMYSFHLSGAKETMEGVRSLYGYCMVWMAICVPLIALISGPATMGATYVLRNYAREKHAWGLSDMLEKASKNYFQGMMIGLINSIVILFMVWMYYYYGNISGTPKMHMVNYIILVILAILLMMQSYIYPMAVSYKLKLKDLYRYSLTLVLLKLPQNVLLLAGTVGFVMLIYNFSISALIAVCLLGGVAIVWYTHLFYTDRVLLENMDEKNEKVYAEPDKEQQKKKKRFV